MRQAKDSYEMNIADVHELVRRVALGDKRPLPRCGARLRVALLMGWVRRCSNEIEITLDGSRVVKEVYG